MRRNDCPRWTGIGTFDTLPIKYALSRIANRRNAARTRLSKKKHLGSAA